MNITENGTEMTVYMQYADWQDSDWSPNEINVSNDSVDFDSKKRMYMSLTPNLDTDQYYTPNLLGGAIEYDVDLSSVMCGCVSSVSVVGMPLLDNWKDPFHYCDANRMGDPTGYLCPEFDIMQANRHAFHAAAHSCDSPVDGIYSNC